MSTFSFVPDKPLTKSVKAAVNRSQFGEGYSQRSSEGINSVRDTLKLSFTVRTRTEIDAIDAFLAGEKGVSSFYYTVPGGSAKRYTCNSWETTYFHDTNAELICTFEREFEP